MSERKVLLTMWVIYDHPKDYPHNYVVRRQRVVSGGAVETDKTAKLAHSLEDARRLIPPGLHNMGRRPDDDPAISETWI